MDVLELFQRFKREYTPDKHTKGVMFRDADGYEAMEHHEAVTYCAAGKIDMLATEAGRDHSLRVLAANELRKQLDRLYGNYRIAENNDRPDGYERIMNAVDAVLLDWQHDRAPAPAEVEPTRELATV